MEKAIYSYDIIVLVQFTLSSILCYGIKIVLVILLYGIRMQSCFLLKKCNQVLFKLQTKLIIIKVPITQPQNNRKRKQHSSSGPANSTGTGNTVGPSPNSPPSTHTPGDGIPTVSKNLMVYGSEGTGGRPSSSNLLVCLQKM